MVSFLAPYLQRILSGAASFFGYSKRTVGLWIISLIMMAFPLIVVQYNWFFVLFMIVNVITIAMKAFSFDNTTTGFFKEYRDIHLWEDLVTGGFMVYMSLTGFNILLLICSVYPSLIIHKGLINLGNNLSFFAKATDDPTGKTYSIPLLGIKVPRSTTKMRLIFAGLSLIALVIILAMNYNLSIDWFKS